MNMQLSNPVIDGRTITFDVAVGRKTGTVLVYGDSSHTFSPEWLGSCAGAKKSEINRLVRDAHAEALEGAIS